MHRGGGALTSIDPTVSVKLCNQLILIDKCGQSSVYFHGINFC